MKTVCIKGISAWNGIEWEKASFMIRIPPIEGATIESRTGQVYFLRKHMKDVIKEFVCSQHMMSRIICRNLHQGPWRIVDMMAGCGFTSRAMLSCLLPEGVGTVILNDLDPVCVDVLRWGKENCPILSQFPSVRICNHNAFEFPWGTEPWDLVWIDFNNFTLKRWDEWGGILEKASDHTDRIVFADSACYGFALGNLERYGVKDAQGYYEALSSQLEMDTGMRVREWASFGNAAIVLAERGFGGKPEEVPFDQPSFNQISVEWYDEPDYPQIF
jgi:hypothetical protein